MMYNQKVVFLWCILWCYFHRTSLGQMVSPCPKFFKYEPNSPEQDRWYGQLTIKSDAELQGIWLRVVLDKPSLQLGNWFGEVVRRDTNDYLIRNPQYKLAANTAYTIRFFVRFDPNESPPQLVSFRINAKTVCPEDGITTPPSLNSGQLLTSDVLSTTNRPVIHTTTTTQEPYHQQPSRPSFNFPNDKDDQFPGDLQILLSHQNNKKQNNNNKFSTEEHCGTVIQQPRPLIYHGVETHEGEFPWHAAIYHSKGIGLTYICGASLITKIHLLTVAHCVTTRKSQHPLKPETVVIYLGKYYLQKWSNNGVQNRNVDKVISHPNYDVSSYSNDIAVLKLASPVEITNFVRPICLWEGDTTLNPIVNKPGVVVGWGFDETGSVSDELTKATMPVVSQETCIYSFPEFYSRFTSTKTFCAGFRNGTSVCNGDSGGGIVFQKPGSNPRNPIWQLRGMISIGVALQNQFKCDASQYVVFTDVAKYLDWVKDAMRE